MKCTNCGETSRIRKEDKFCHRCGHELQNGESDILTESVEKTIVSICDWVQREIDKVDVLDRGQMPEMINALAKLIATKTLIREDINLR